MKTMLGVTYDQSFFLIKKNKKQDWQWPLITNTELCVFYIYGEEALKYGSTREIIPYK